MDLNDYLGQRYPGAPPPDPMARILRRATPVTGAMPGGNRAALGFGSAPAPVAPSSPGRYGSAMNRNGVTSQGAAGPAPTAAPAAPAAPAQAQGYNQNYLTPEQQQIADWTRHHGLGGLGSQLAGQLQGHFAPGNEYDALTKEATGYNQEAVGDQTRAAARNFSDEMAARGLNGSGLETQGLSNLYGQEGAGLGRAYLSGLQQRLAFLNQQQQFQNEMQVLRQQQTGSSPWGDILGAGLSFLPGSGAFGALAKLFGHGGESSDAFAGPNGGYSY